jgi:hypothetical protein
VRLEIAVAFGDAFEGLADENGFAVELVEEELAERVGFGGGSFRFGS